MTPDEEQKVRQVVDWIDIHKPALTRVVRHEYLKDHAVSTLKFVVVAVTTAVSAFVAVSEPAQNFVAAIYDSVTAAKTDE